MSNLMSCNPKKFVNMKLLNLCTFNARSIRNKMAELSNFIHSHKIHVLAVSETWLSSLDSDGEIILPGFQAPFRKDRNTKGGGVCIFLSNQLSGKRRGDLEDPELELLWVEIKLSGYHRSLLVGCCYRPPQSGKLFFEKLEATLNKVINQDILLLGDFNAKNSEWFNEDCTNPNGIALKDLTDHFDLTQLCRRATHLNHDGEPESLLDLVFTNVPELFSESARVLPPIGSSDHLPVVIQSKSAEYFNSQETPTYTKWTYHQKDQEKMNDAFLYDNWKDVFLHTDIDEMWSQWKSRFFSEVKTFIPCVEPQSSKRTHRRISPPWFNKDIRRLVRAKNRLFKRAQSSGSAEHWEIYRSARNKTTTAVKTAKHQHLTLQAERLADPNCSSSRWWQIAKEMCGLKRNSSRDIPPLTDQSLGLVCEDHKKADLLNDTFINSNTSLSQNSFPIGPSKLESIFEFQELSPDEVKNAIRSLPNKTSTGPDNISYRLLKEAGPNIVGPLTTLYNYSLRMHQIPEEWKMAVVSPIFKGGHRDRDKPSNYRPISLTSCVARLMEKLLNGQILKYLQNHSLLYQHQSGFLPGHSTVTQLCFLVHQWQMAADRGDHVQATFLDLSKAYDRVSIPGLLFKLSCLGFSYSALQWLSAFLTNRLQSVKVNGCQSKWQTPKSGIPQGTVLGPVLFLAFINNFNTFIPQKWVLNFRR